MHALGRMTNPALCGVRRVGISSNLKNEFRPSIRAASNRTTEGLAQANFATLARNRTGELSQWSGSGRVRIDAAWLLRGSPTPTPKARHRLCLLLPQAQISQARGVPDRMSLMGAAFNRQLRLSNCGQCAIHRTVHNRACAVLLSRERPFFFSAAVRSGPNYC